MPRLVRNMLAAAGCLALAAIFPLLGLLGAAVVVGIAISNYHREPNYDKYRPGSHITPEKLLEDLRNEDMDIHRNARQRRTHRRSR